MGAAALDKFPLGDKLESIAGDLALYVCERFYAKQDLQGMVTAYMALLEYLFGSYPECCASYAFWKVRKDKEGKDADGPASVKSQRTQDMWWVGYQEAITGAARGKKAFLMLPSQEALDEVLGYLTGPVRQV